MNMKNGTIPTICREVVVIGGGPAGLSLARSLAMSVADSGSADQVAFNNASSVRTLASLSALPMRADLISRMVILSISSP